MFKYVIDVISMSTHFTTLGGYINIHNEVPNISKHRFWYYIIHIMKGPDEKSWLEQMWIRVHVLHLAPQRNFGTPKQTTTGPSYTHALARNIYKPLANMHPGYSFLESMLLLLH